MKIIWEYSAKKNKAKIIPGYSILYPETSSDSPSDKSNGALLVSATEEIKNNNDTGKKEKINNPDKDWKYVRDERFKDPITRTIVNIINPKDIS